MRALRELRHTGKPQPLPLMRIKEAHYDNKPGFIVGTLSGSRWRHQSMGLTLDHIIDQEKLAELQLHASDNLKLWEKSKETPPQKVEVVHQDFGDAALDATMKHGKIYPVLNMASSFFPGGAVLEGGDAQEENIWHRSTCAQTLLSKGVYYDAARKCFLYDENTRKLLSAQEKMTPEELQALGIRRGVKVPEAYKVFMGDQPQICFRGAEVFVPTGAEEGFSSKHAFVADADLSYQFLPKNRIFPFYELRSAAPELIGKTIEPSDKLYAEDLSRRVGAQLDTLILKGKTDAILGAWGCGSFKNYPDIVAQVYREEIEKRAGNFQHIVFPIIDTEHEANFEIFKKHLDGLKLGASKSALSPYGLYAPRDTKPTTNEGLSQTPSI
ncbi:MULTISPECIES: poly(ADP-ribose) glycohydrolase domain-containing protein [Legionella]|uniref:Microbial-type PARG catalytic domain-containing protein n=1 Tax=Legionella steelei TaxID=947033 RepID=A0A0W0ZDG3_9GAMM|nr:MULTISPECIES: poly(ADP-ribose) glycohydrolase domain-containing protein [Legionella]KTD67229.1 hypothetical protein Lste_3435 [Legionella steelei]MBN9228230.1 DUF2263 domain-containing protein [Legionella steelei]OJW09476.1 MAG: hypothetical protein BGO44_04150 [Legionella sp. 39-23]